ncbi:MAG: response regulator [Pseudobdellovibrio sp.]
MLLNILINDDEPLIIELFSDLFGSSEVFIMATTSPQEAITYSQNNPIDLAFLDYRMPLITGDTVAQKMPSEIPKYLVTGEFDLSPIYKFNKILKKPLDITEIQKIIDQALAYKKSQIN